MEEAVTKVVILSSQDARENGKALVRTVRGNDGDLFESNWRHKAKRYLHFFRDSGSAKVVTDLRVIKEDEPVPDGYSGLFLADDSMERALRKHVLCFKAEYKASAKHVIADIVLVHTGKRENIPSGYRATNEVNDIQIAWKLQTVTQVKALTDPQVSVTKEIPVQADASSRAADSHPKTPVSALDGIPFQINPKFDVKGASDDPIISSLRLLSLDDINNQFFYDFTMEESVKELS